MATIGDPFMDLGTTLGYWMDKNDLPELKLFQLSATTLEGNPTREGILEMYESKSGKTIPNPVFYYVFGLFKAYITHNPQTLLKHDIQSSFDFVILQKT